MCLTTRTMNMVNFIPPDIRTVSAEWLSLHQHDSGISSSQQQIPLDRPIATNCYSYHDTSRFDDFIAESEATEDAAKLLNIVSVKVCASTCMFNIQKKIYKWRSTTFLHIYCWPSWHNFPNKRLLCSSVYFKYIVV